MSKQKIYIKALVWFFAVMLMLTVVSRMADSLTVAKSDVQQAKRGAIVHKTYGNGIIEASDKIYVQTYKNLKIKNIKVNEGEKVNAGDILAEFDRKDIEEQIYNINADIKSLVLRTKQLKLQIYNNNDESEISKAKLELKRAEEDYNLSIKLNEGKEMLAEKRKMEDARLNLEDKKNQKEKNIADAKVAKEKNQIDIELAQIEIESKSRELDKLYETQSKGNVIKSEINGTVSEIFVKIGQKTTEENILSVIPDKSPCYFKAKIENEEAKYIKVGDSIDVTVSGNQIPIKNVTVKSVNNTVDNGSKTEITGLMPQDARVSNGMQASMVHIDTTVEFDKIIPLSAVRSTQNSDYVLVVKEVNTVMGNEYIAFKINVTVVDKDRNNAAIADGINLSDEIIINTNKPIAEGDRVRRNTK